MQTSVAVIAGDDARASDFNKVVADISEIYAGGPGVPIGAAVMWWSDNTVPLNYKVCDGTTISDSDSPLNGLTSPNMSNKFARGVPNANLRTSPQTGGADTINLAHSHTVDSHNHYGGDVYTSPTNTNHFHGGIQRGGSFSDGQTPDHAHAYSRSIENRSPGTSSSLSNGVSIVPGWRGWVWIMRIK